MAGQLWATDTLGGLAYSDELSDVLRTAVQPLAKFRQFCDAKDATKEGYGKELHRGDLYHWNIYGNVSRQGGTLTETQTIPETNFTITQGTLTVNEYGQAVPYTGKLDNLSKHPIKEIIKKAHKNDARKAFDIAAWRQFNTTKLRVVPSGGTSTTALTLTTNGTCTVTNNIAMQNDHVKLIVDLMKERNIPPYTADDYFCISHPSTYRTFKNNLETIHQYTAPGLQMIMHGEIGRHESTRFVEQTFIPKGGAADTTTFDPETGTADAWNNALSSWAFFFGEDTVAEAMVIPEEIRGKIPTDYGRSKGIAWYYLGGFAIVHTVAEQSRIVKWDSGV